jgi:hypothetical protein
MALDKGSIYVLGWIGIYSIFEQEGFHEHARITPDQSSAPQHRGGHFGGYSELGIEAPTRDFVATASDESRFP